jgi:hypothetical protein
VQFHIFESPKPPYISSTAAMLSFGRTSFVFHEKRLVIYCFPGKVMDISYPFGTNVFSTFNYLRGFYCFTGIWVAEFAARGQGYAVTPISQFLNIRHTLFFPAATQFLFTISEHK